MSAQHQSSINRMRLAVALALLWCAAILAYDTWETWVVRGELTGLQEPTAKPLDQARSNHTTDRPVSAITPLSTSLAHAGLPSNNSLDAQHSVLSALSTHTCLQQCSQDCLLTTSDMALLRQRALAGSWNNAVMNCVDLQRYVLHGDTFYVPENATQLDPSNMVHRLYWAFLEHPMRVLSAPNASFEFFGLVDQFNGRTDCSTAHNIAANKKSFCVHGTHCGASHSFIAAHDLPKDLCGRPGTIAWRASINTHVSPPCHLSVGDPIQSFFEGPPSGRRRSRLACFRGQRYPGFPTDVRFQMLQAFRYDPDVLVSMKCHSYYYNHVAKNHTADDAITCPAEAISYDATAGLFMEWLDTCHFTLAPRGIGWHSYRLIEALAWGSIPVVLSDNYTLPFPNLIDWNQVAVVVPESQVAKISSILKTIGPATREAMQRAGWDVYQRFFRTPERWVNAGMQQMLQVANRSLHDWIVANNCTLLR